MLKIRQNSAFLGTGIFEVLVDFSGLFCYYYYAFEGDCPRISNFQSIFFIGGYIND